VNASANKKSSFGTLRSDKAEGFWKLIGVVNQYTISVDGILTLDGVIVTHVRGVIGGGVFVNDDGEFFMNDGEVSGNDNNGSGGGVYVYPGGSFVMSGGTITNNTALYGGGVSMCRGSFEMSGGTIANNTAYYNGGGVEMVPDNSFVNGGSFSMSGGVIANNRVRDGLGCGVYMWSGSFTLSGNGVIANNTALSGGGSGVYITSGSFVLSDEGVVVNNTGYGVYVRGAPYNVGSFYMKGGVVANNTGYYGVRIDSDCSFVMSDGIIADNNGGVFLCSWSSFELSGGTISGNTALYGGGGVYIESGCSFVMLDGTICNNTAGYSMYGGGFGGGVFVAHGGSFVMSGGKIWNNTAVSDMYGGGIGGGVCVNGSFVMTGGVIAGNTASVNGGGVYVTDTNAVVDFERLTVGADAAFWDNRASVAYSRDSLHDVVYETQIKGTNWTSPFTQGYNNYDIGYTAGTLLTHSVSVSGNYSTLSGAGSYLIGSSVTINAGSRSGYTFSGWTVNEGGISLSNSATATFTMPARDVMVTANWSPISYTINYVLNSGTNAAGNPSSYNVGSTFPITINNPSRSGYEFLGWNVLYVNGSQVSSQTSYRIPIGTIGNIELTANWRAIDSGGNGGSGGSGSGGSSGGGSSSKPSPSPSAPTSSEPTPSSSAPSVSPDSGNESETSYLTTVLVLVIIVLVVIVLVVVGLLLRKGSKV